MGEHSKKRLSYDHETMSPSLHQVSLSWMPAGRFVKPSRHSDREGPGVAPSFCPQMTPALPPGLCAPHLARPSTAVTGYLQFSLMAFQRAGRADPRGASHKEPGLPGQVLLKKEERFWDHLWENVPPCGWAESKGRAKERKTKKLCFLHPCP